MLLALLAGRRSKSARGLAERHYIFRARRVAPSRPLRSVEGAHSLLADNGSSGAGVSVQSLSAS